MNVEDSVDLSGLSQEQADTDRLLRQLLGTAIADRYADFCRLAGGTLPLIVSRPLAGHALRELDFLSVMCSPRQWKLEPSTTQRRHDGGEKQDAS